MSQALKEVFENLYFDSADHLRPTLIQRDFFAKLHSSQKCSRSAAKYFSADGPLIVAYLKPEMHRALYEVPKGGFRTRTINFGLGAFEAVWSHYFPFNIYLKEWI